MKCSVEDCDRPAHCRGWCPSHWSRWRRHGDPLGFTPKPPPLYEHPNAQPDLCAVPGCGRKLRARGVCVTHYQRWRDTGSVLADEPVLTYADEETRFWANVDKRGPDDCWHWTGLIDDGGYGRISVSNMSRLAHRWSCERYNGPVLPDQHVDHVCHNRDRTCQRGPKCLHRRCVNPAHLEAVSPATNTHRANGATEDVCRAGHPRTEENTKHLPGGGRTCLLCRRAAGRRYARKKREEARVTYVRELPA